VDVWEVALGPCARDAAARILSDPEREFAARLRVGAGPWGAARVALRRVLGGYLGLAPGQVALTTDTNGKPRLASGGNADLRFNLSHSGDLALIAVRLGHEVGVDVEAVRAGVDGAAIARDVFGARGRAGRAVLDGGEPGEGFFRTWVRREALAKAIGRGIVSPLSPGEAARFTIRDLDGIPGFTAAVASEGSDWSVRRSSAPPHPAIRASAHRAARSRDRV
jgi:4'-phosphopantetheinyl transferase